MKVAPGEALHLQKLQESGPTSSHLSAGGRHPQMQDAGEEGTAPGCLLPLSALPGSSCCETIGGIPAAHASGTTSIPAHLPPDPLASL